MMRLSFLLLVPLIAGCSSQPAPTPVAKADYYPLAVGDTWTYKMSPGTKVYDAQLTANRTIGKTQTCAMAVEDSYSFMAVQPDGVYQYGEGDPDDPKHAIIFNPPQLIYKLPFKVGDEWETPVLSEPTQMNSETVYVSGQVDSVGTVTVPAGTFANCVKVSVDDPRDAPADRTDLWFAPNVGIIKTVTYITIGAGKPKTTTTELVKYKLAEGAKP